MEEIKWWARLLMVSGVLALVLLVAGPMGYKFGVAGLAPSLISLVISLVGSGIVLVVSVIMVVIAGRKGLTANRNVLLIGIACCIVPILVMVPQLVKARSVPPIHDITTDTANPPMFRTIVGLRAGAANPLDYGAGLESPAKLAEMQINAYPDVKPLETTMSVPEAVRRAEEILVSQGLEVVNVDASAGMVEAVATTFWFGFKDDLVVRVTATDIGSTIDVRSVSRVGQSDVGANAARITAFLDDF